MQSTNNYFRLVALTRTYLCTKMHIFYNLIWSPLKVQKVSPRYVVDYGCLQLYCIKLFAVVVVSCCCCFCGEAFLMFSVVIMFMTAFIMKRHPRRFTNPNIQKCSVETRLHGLYIVYFLFLVYCSV